MKNQLKQQYGNFKAEGSETLEQTFNRLQAIVSHLEFMDVPIEKDDLNQKFLTSLAPEWLMYTIVWRNKDDLDTMSLDDLYNHLKVYEPEVQKKAGSNSQNMAFISSSNTSSGKGEVPTASVPTASSQVSTVSTEVAAASLSHDTICAYIATQSSGSQIKYEDITQIDEDDIEEMDIKWNLALLSMRADRFWKKTGKKITIQGSDVAGFDKSKVECFNCHKMGHFARECRAPRSQDRGKRESYRKDPKVEEPAPKALMAIDGIGWDWSYMANEDENHALVADDVVPTEFALMAMSSSSSSSDNEVYDDSYCSKSCRKNTENLNTKINKLNEELSDCETDLYNYKRGLSQVEARLVEFKVNETKFCERIRVLERDVEIRDNKIESLKNELEELKKEKESIDHKLAGFGNASKDLNDLLESQKSAKDKTGVGFNEYTAVPPPPAQVYSPPKKDLSWMGLPEFVDDTVTDYSRPTPSIKVSKDVSIEQKSNSDSSFEKGGSVGNITSKPKIRFVKETGCPSASKVNNTENSRKPTVKYAEMYRNTSQSPRVRGNQRNWNNQKSQQLGSNFVMNNKACFACGSFNHLIKDCKRKVQKHVWNNARRVNHHNSHKMSYPHPKRNFVPKAVLMKTGMRPLNAARPGVGVNAAKQKAAYNAVKGNRFNVVKASACWVWMPKNRVVDHVSQNIKDDLEDPSKQGRKIALIDKDHFCSDGCTNSGEAGVQQGQQRQKIKKKSRRFDSRTSSEDLHAGRKTKKMKSQQAALDNALVPLEKRLKIKRCNARIAFSKPQREETYQVTLEALKLSPYYPAFQITAEVPYVPEFSIKTLLHHLQKKNWLHSFKNLAILASVICYLQFILIKCTSLRGHVLQSSIDFMYQADNREISSARKEHMPYLRFTKVIINHFISKDKKISLRNRINLHTIRDDSLLGTLKFVSKTQDYQKYGAPIPDDIINQDIKDSTAYKTYYDFATGNVPLGKARKYKKVASPLRKLSPVKEAEPVKKAKRVNAMFSGLNFKEWKGMRWEGKNLRKECKRPAKKSTTVPTAGFVIRDTPGVSTSKKKAPTKVDRSKGIEILFDVALSEADQLKEATKNYTKPGVPDVPTYDSESENESWGDNEDDNDDDNKGDDDKADSDADGNSDADDNERTDLDDDDDENPSFTLKDYDKEEHDEEYESDDDYGNVFEEEDDDLYKDVDVRSLGAEHEKERKGDEEMTDADQNVSQEKSYEQVVEDAHVTLTSSQKTKSSKQCSSISSNFASKVLILENVSPTIDKVTSMMNVKSCQEESSTQAPSLFTVPETAILETAIAHATTVPPTISMITPLLQLMTPSPAPTTIPTTTSIPALPEFSSLFRFDQRVSTLETELSQLKQSDILHNSSNLSNLNSNNAQEERKLYIDVVEKLVTKIIKDEVKSQLPQIFPKEISDFPTPVIQSTVLKSLENVILAKSSSQPQSTYEAVASLTEFELKKILLDKLEKSISYRAAKVHRNLYDVLVKSYQLDKDLFDSYGKAYSLKRSREDMDKDEDPPAKPDQGPSKGSKSQLKSSGKSDQAEEPVFETADTEMPKDQGGNMGNIKDQPNVEAASKHDYQIAKAEKPPLTFDELMSTLIDFSAYVMNHLKIDNLTQQHLVGPTFNLLKGTCKSRVELEYHFEECYKAVTDRLDWTNHEGHQYPFNLSKLLPLIEVQGRQVVPGEYFFNNDLGYLKSGSLSRKYTTSITKTKAAKYDNIEGIEDMVKMLWSLMKVAYDKYALWGISYWGPKRQRFYGFARHMKSTHDVYSRKKIIAVIYVQVMKKYDYGYLEEIKVQRDDNTLHKFKEGDFLNLNLRDIEDMLLLLPETFRSDISKLTPYIAYKNPQRIIYQDKLKRNRLMHSDELYKFYDDTLTYVRRVLHDIAFSLEMDYLPKRTWSKQDMKRSHIMIKAIDQRLFKRRLMSNLEKFVTGREYENDFRLLERTI
ncbi:reverse transcriptase domain-containing protein [Tanacetum coccineum]